MIQINAVITALMVTWVRRHISQSDSSWCSLLNKYVNSAFTKGENYADLKTNEIQNPFWKDIVRGWKYFCKLV